MRIETYSEHLEKKDGIYYSKNQSDVSYPNDGNNLYFQIEDDSFWFKHRNNCIIEVAKNFCSKSPIFDIGGGNGYVAKGLTSNGIETVLVEPGIQGVQNANKARRLDKIICSTIEDAHFKKNTIPSVGLFDVIEHINDDVLFLKKIHEIIEPFGYLLITVPAYKLLWSSEDKIAGHFRRYTRKELCDKLKLIDYKIVYSSYFFSLLPLPIFLFRTLPSLLGFNQNQSNTKKYKSQHKKKSFIEFFLNIELNKIRAKRDLKFGSSCIIVAQKTK